MKLTIVMVSAVTLAYLVTAFAFMWKGNYPMGTVYLGYCLANLGLIAADLATKA